MKLMRDGRVGRERKMKVRNSPILTSMTSTCEGSRRHMVALSGVDAEFGSKLACSGCGRWVEANRSVTVSSRSVTSPRGASRPHYEQVDDKGEYEECGMESEVKKRPLAPLASFSYCASCKGLVCSLCVSTHLDAMACPQCLSLHAVSSGNTSTPTLGKAGGLLPNALLSSSSFALASLFSNRCKKCSSCPSCNSPALGLRSLSIKDAPEQLKKMFFPLHSSPLPNVSPTSAPSISFFYCSFCRWASIDPVNGSISGGSSQINASEQSSLGADSHSSLSPSSSSSPSSNSISSMLYADSTAKLISKTLSIERQSSNSAHFNAIVEQRRSMRQKDADSSSSSSYHHSLASLTSSSTTRTSKQGGMMMVRGKESLSSDHSMTSTPPLLHLISQRIQDAQETWNNPKKEWEGRKREKSTEEESSSMGFSITPDEEIALKEESSELDEAWRYNQENPMLFFKPLPREPLSPLHLSSAKKNELKNRVSPIGRVKKEEEKKGEEKEEKKGESSHSHPNSLHHYHHQILPSFHPERIPLFPICSKKCIKCDRVLVKPTTEGTSLSQNTWSSLSSGADPSSSFASLPEFKRRHTALSFTPMIDVKATDAFEDYKPTLQWDTWNTISITLSNPPSLPAVLVTLSSDFNPLDSPSQHDSLHNDVDEDKKDPKGEGKEEEESDQKPKPIFSSSDSSPLPLPPSDPHSICHVDCNGCETWILEDTILLDEEDAGDGEEGGNDPSPPPSWLSHPGVPSFLQLLEADTENPAISDRKSRLVTMVLLVMPDSKKFNLLKSSLSSSNPTESSSSLPSSSSSLVPPTSPMICCDLRISVSWPSPTDANPNARHELSSPFRINLSKIFEVVD